MAKKKDNSDEIFFGLTLNPGQENLREAIMNPDNQVIIVNAVAGSGKTLISIACARLLTYYHGFEGAVYVFPTVEENSLGFRPGDTKEKEADYLEPLYDALESINEIPRQAIKSDISDKNGTSWVEARSSTFMRGINLNKKVLIIDECQNLSVPLIKRIISRCHDNCKVIVLGCSAQMDISPSKSGFLEFIAHMSDYEGCVEVELDTSYRGRLAEHIDLL